MRPLERFSGRLPIRMGPADYGAVSEANGVVYGGSLSGKMFALDAQTGKVLW